MKYWMNNLLRDPLIRIETIAGVEQLTLPAVFASLVANRVESFPALRAHQSPAWHMFLAQLGAIAMHRAGLVEPPADVESWLEIIQALTKDEFPGDEPWQLVVADRSRPAFMQPPVPDGAKFTDVAMTPDALDMLATSKNHDVKQTVASIADVDNWVFALVTQQTIDGALTNNPKSLQLGIARMNSGDGSRVFMGFAPSVNGNALPRWGRHVTRDMARLSGCRADPSAEWSIYGSPDEIKPALTWVYPWSAENSLPLHTLDPLFIEICRVIRLERQDDLIVARRAGSPGRRVDGKAFRGVTGDPWAPINIVPAKSNSNPTGEPVVLTAPESGFSYQLLCRVIFDESEFLHPIAMKLTADELRQQDHWVFVARAIIRQQGGTNGYAERVIPFGRLGVRRVLLARKELHLLAKQQIEEIEKIDKILRDALALAAAGGVLEKVKEKHYVRTRSIRQRLNTEADRIFFEALWQRFDAEQSGVAESVAEARRTFVEGLAATARTLLIEAMADIPVSAIQRPRAQARAERRFASGLRHHEFGFPEFFAPAPVGPVIEETAADAA
jgi:CRISPR system Cascade subunit CasA